MPVTIEDLKRSIDNLATKRQDKVVLARDRFVEKETPIEEVVEEVSKTNDILKNMALDAKKIKSNSKLPLKLPLIAGATAALGAGIASVATLSKKMLEGANAQLQLDTVRKRLDDQAVKNNAVKIKALEKMLKLGDITQKEFETGKFGAEKTLELQKRFGEVGVVKLKAFGKEIDPESKHFATRILKGFSGIIKKFADITTGGKISRQEEITRDNLFKAIQINNQMFGDVIKKGRGNTANIGGLLQQSATDQKGRGDTANIGGLLQQSPDRTELKEKIKRSEGLRLESYQDTSTGRSIGYGHFEAGNALKGKKIDVAEAERLFEKDFKEAEGHAKKLPGFNNLDLKGQDALIDMMYNMGPNRFNERKWPNFFRALESGNINAAVDSIQASKYAEQVGVRATQNIGLLRGGRNTKISATPDNIQAPIDRRKQLDNINEFKKMNDTLKKLPDEIGKAIGKNIKKQKPITMSVGTNSYSE